MAEDRIDIGFICRDQIQVISWSVVDLEYVEDLVFKILESKGVGPVYRLLFGLCFSDKPVWLAPNVRLKDLIPSHGSKQQNTLTLHLRMRYRPSSYSLLARVDNKAFEMIYDQIRFDFRYSKLFDEKRDSVLFNCKVLGLIGTDLLRHAMEENIEINDILNKVNLHDFIPQQALNWQRHMLYKLRDMVNLERNIQTALSCCGRNILRIKQGFIELLLHEVCKEYGSESYRIICIDNPDYPREMDIRIRYDQTPEDSRCIIECRPISQNVSNEWTELCDIFTISYGTLRKNTFEINRSNGVPFRAIYETEVHAKSFASMIDGYYRHMRKWNFNFCRRVISPDLDKLKKMKCHGPIGVVAMQAKLSKNRKSGSFLIRRCLEKSNRYLIDVLLPSKTRLSIQIDWEHVEKVFYKVGQRLETIKPVTVLLKNTKYSSLKSLVNDIQIIDDEEGGVSRPFQLKYWIPPSEYDDYPNLLLSISVKKFEAFDMNQRELLAISDLPRIIEPHMLRITNKTLSRACNQMIVKRASFNGKPNFVIKSHIETDGTNGYKDLILNLSHRGNLSPKQLKLADWIFINNPLFVETIGLTLDYSLIQEYYQHGNLEEYLLKNNTVTDAFKQSISCQLACALLYLQEKRIVHGKIRCRNIFLKELCPISIKLSDPLGTFDAHKDQAFLAPECFGLDGIIGIQEYDSAIDVWAFGTTLWQLYSDGQKPPERRYANTLIQPISCLNHIWSLIESCWVIDASQRASPHVIYRDINDAFAWEPEIHDYHYIHQHEDYSKPPDIDEKLSKRESRASNSASSNEGGSEMNLIPQNNIIIPDCRPRLTNISNMKQNTDKIFSGKKRGNQSWRNMISFKSRTSAKVKYNNLSASSKTSIPSCYSSTESDLNKLNEIIDSQSVAGEPETSDFYINPRHLKLNIEIGRGSSGTVIKAVLSRPGTEEQVVAVKSNNVRNADECRNLRREYEILKSLNHVNIIKTLGLVDGKNMMMVVEYLPFGSLLSFMKQANPANLPLQKYALDIAKGMEYLEKMKVVHRDLALRNILLKELDEVKICDFGLAQNIGTSCHYRYKTSRLLPIKWYAPEAIETGTFSHKSDVWSYGIVLWEIYSGGANPQYSGPLEKLHETLKHERLNKPNECPESMYSLMMSCWNYEPDNRKNFTEIAEILGSGNSDCLI